MLEEARTHVIGGIFPAAPVYLLRFFDVTGHGVTLMILTQNYCLLLGLMIILKQIGTNTLTSVVSLIILIATPTVIGCMLVLWKDVTLTSLMILPQALIFWATQSKSKNSATYVTAKWAAILLLVIGTLVRFNAITATFVIAIYWLTVFYSGLNFLRRAYATLAIVVIMGTCNFIINNYRFPDLHKLAPNPLAYGVMAYDLIGISGWSRVPLLPIDAKDAESTPKIAVSEIDKIYSSLGSLKMYDNNIALGNSVKIYPDKYTKEDILNAWFSAVYNYPIAYLNFRHDLFSEIIGAKSHETFEPTHFNRIDGNKFGINFHDNHITDTVLNYIRLTSNLFWGKPCFIFSKQNP
ncbi:MAG: hypothetical protein ABL903_09420 [Methylococcales bacterium]